jgi:sortase A
MIRRLLFALEIALTITGVVCLAWYVYWALSLRAHQAQYSRQLEGLIAARARDAALQPHHQSPGVTLPEPPSPSSRIEGDLVGRIQIPRIGVSAAVVYGDSDPMLRIAVGQLPGTPRPGHRGNVVLAGHRDTFFYNLRGIRVGDRIRMELPQNDYLYDVTKILIVKPEDVWVLNDTPEGVLTLITCYPFHYVGPAPMRFIVQASLASQ